MTGMRGLDYKDRRRQRRRNHIAKDLLKPKYAQRIVPDRRKKKLNEEGDEYYYDDTE